MFYLWVAIGILGFVVVGGVALYFMLRSMGQKIPVEHQATSVMDIHAPIERVFDVIADIRSHPTWASGVRSVEQIHDKGEMEAVRIRMGHNTFVMVRTRHEPPVLIERTISDPGGPFSGTWLYKLKPLPPDAAGGAVCEVRLTETGRVGWPAARALMKHVFGYHVNTHRHLKDLAGKFEAHPAKPRRG